MKIFAIAIVALGLLAISPLVFADTFADKSIDALVGKNDAIETSLYVAKTFSLDDVPFIGTLADLRIKATTFVGDDFFDKGELSIGLEF